MYTRIKYHCRSLSTHSFVWACVFSRSKTKRAAARVQDRKKALFVAGCWVLSFPLSRIVIERSTSIACLGKGIERKKILGENTACWYFAVTTSCAHSTAFSKKGEMLLFLQNIGQSTEERTTRLKKVLADAAIPRFITVQISKQKEQHEKKCWKK